MIEALSPVSCDCLLNVERLDILETNVGVEDQQGTEDGIHDRVQGAGSEGSDGQRDQSDRDESRSTLALIVLIYTPLHLSLQKPKPLITHLSNVQW